MEEGTTTTPFDVGRCTSTSLPVIYMFIQMMLSNHVSRFHVAVSAIILGAGHNPKVSVDAHQLVTGLMHQVAVHKAYVLKHATDMKGVYDTPTF